MDKQQTLTFNEKNIAEFRASHGRIASFGDAPLLLLTTTGARSGQRRTSPMMYLADEHDPNRVYVFASYAGADQNPAWFHNVVAHPDDIEVELGDERLPRHRQGTSRSTPRRGVRHPGRPLPRLRRIPGKDVTGDPGDRTHVAALSRSEARHGDRHSWHGGRCANPGTTLVSGWSPGHIRLEGSVVQGRSRLPRSATHRRGSRPWRRRERHAWVRLAGAGRRVSGPPLSPARSSSTSPTRTRRPSSWSTRTPAWPKSSKRHCPRRTWSKP